jgi:hypothetical protein
LLAIFVVVKPRPAPSRLVEIHLRLSDYVTTTALADAVVAEPGLGAHLQLRAS